MNLDKYKLLENGNKLIKRDLQKIFKVPVYFFAIEHYFYNLFLFFYHIHLLKILKSKLIL